jgi:hypothetical protein
VAAGCISDAYILPTMPHVAEYARPKTNTSTMTSQRPGLVGETDSEAYNVPMVNMQNVRTNPPVMMLLRRDTLSARRRAGILISSMRIAERPDARNEDVLAEIPA